MKKLFLLALVASAISNANAQAKYMTKTGKVTFDAGTGLEDITGINKSVTTAIDAVKGDIVFKMQIKAFEFKSQLMQDHFNENYMESEKYPVSTFKGKIVNLDKVNFSKDGTYKVKVKGEMEIHGVKNKDVEADGEIVVKGTDLEVKSDFVVKMDDYKINIPSVVKDKLASKADIKVNCKYSIVKQ
jgi:hypothetical protein